MSRHVQFHRVCGAHLAHPSIRPFSDVRRKFPSGGPKHRRSQGRAKGVIPPPKLVENIVILCFEGRFSKQNCVIRLKLNILVYTVEY